MKNNRDALGDAEMSTLISDALSGPLLEFNIQASLMYKPSIVHMIGTAIRHRKFKLFCYCFVSSENRLLLYESH